MIASLAMATSVMGGMASCATGSVPEAQPSVFPDTQEGRDAKAIIDLFNSGDVPGLAAFMRERFSDALLSKMPADEASERFMGFARMIGRVVPFSFGPSPVGGVQTLVRNRSATAWAYILIAHDDGGKISRFGIKMDGEGAPDEVGVRRLDDDGLAESVDALLDDLAAHDEFSGTVLVASEKAVIYAGSRGMSDREHRVPAAADTKYNLGSVGKIFTAVAIAQLASAGRISYDATVASLLPGYPNAEVAAKVTVRHLLTHTSGLGDVFVPAYFERGGDFRTVNDWMELFVREPLLFEPGTAAEYSNAGFVVLGAIIERASGMDYHAYIRKHILEPLAMRDTGPFPKGIPADNLAIGYAAGAPGSQAREPNDAFLPYSGFPAGGYYASAGDLLRFARGLLNATILDRESVALLTSWKIDLHPGSGAGYGFGFQVGTEGDMPYFGHNGGIEGVSAVFRVFPESGKVVIVLSNYDPPTADMIMGYVSDRISK
jgi:CubicO group peptidase (beta-lactamase class C family)